MWGRGALRGPHMDEAVAILIAVCFVLAVPASLVLALVAWSRSKRVRQLEQRVAALERDVRPAAPAPGFRADAAPQPVGPATAC